MDQSATGQPPAIHIADFILRLQTADGAILDRPGVITVNEDSNMEYTLIDLAAAYLALGITLPDGFDNRRKSAAG